MKKVNKGKFIPLNTTTHCDTGMINIRYINSGSTWPDLEMIVWDCDRKITLDFSFEKAKHAKQKIRKINQFRKALDELEQYIRDHKKALKDNK